MNCNVLYLNARSLKSVKGKRNKLVQLQNMIATDDIHMVVATETWLNSKVNDMEIFPSNYVVHRKDREETVTNKRGGGVLLAVTNGFASQRRCDLEPKDEILVCEITTPNSPKLMVIVCYRPPSGVSKTFSDNVIRTIKNTRAVTENILMLGDFNLPNVDWINCVHDGNGAEAELCQFLNDVHLQQVNDIPSNVHGNMLDLVFSTAPEKLSPVEEYPGEFDTDHTVLKFSFNAGARPKRAVVKWCLIIRKGITGGYDKFLAA